jgi:hypothetical protein
LYSYKRIFIEFSKLNGKLKLQKNNYNIYIKYNMPQKINMIISNGNPSPVIQKHILNTASLGSSPSMAAPRAPSALNAPILARVHNVRPGCGSCGRH